MNDITTPRPPRYSSKGCTACWACAEACPRLHEMRPHLPQRLLPREVVAFACGHSHTPRRFHSFGNPISSRLNKLPPSPIIDNIFRFKSLSGLIILLMYFMQHSTVKTLLGCMARNVSRSMNGLSAFVGSWMFMMLRRFQMRLWYAQQFLHTAIAWSQFEKTRSSLRPKPFAIAFFSGDLFNS